MFQLSWPALQDFQDGHREKKTRNSLSDRRRDFIDIFQESSIRMSMQFAYIHACRIKYAPLEVAQKSANY